MSSALIFTIFGVVVAALLAIDLFIVHPAGKAVTIRSAALWSIVWILAGLGFGVGIMGLYGGGPAISSYLTAYVVEKVLSVDNIFLWLLVFTGLEVPKESQRRVLIFGVAGAVVLRTVMILAGTAIVERFAFILILAGAFLIYAGIKLIRERKGEPAGPSSSPQPAEPKLFALLRRVIPTTQGWHGDRFFAVEGGVTKATPLLLVLLLIELTDVVLALDALPAGLSITTDVNIILTSNLFAVLGLRSLYFLLAGVVEGMHYLKLAVAVILIYIGGSLLIEQLLPQIHIDTLTSLSVIVIILAAAVWASLRRERRQRAAKSS